MAIQQQANFIKLFNESWCWKAVELAHLNEEGDAKNYLMFIGQLEVGTSGSSDFSKVTEESRVPGGDYIYLQTVIKTAEGKPAYTRIFINMDNDTVYDARSKRTTIINNREVVSFTPAQGKQADDFLNLEGCRESVGKLCDRLGKDRSEIKILT